MASTDILTLDEARAAISLAPQQTDSLDDELGDYVTAITTTFEVEFGAIVNQTYSGETHSGMDAWGNAKTELFLNRGPIYLVSSLVEYSTTGVATTCTLEQQTSKTVNDFLISDSGWSVLRRARGFDACFAGGRRNIVVTYQAGRAADTSSVPDRFKVAAQMMLRHLWSAAHGVGSQLMADGLAAPGVTATGVPTFAVPSAARALLRDDVAPLVAL